MKCKIIRDDMEVSFPGGWEKLPPSLKEQVEVRSVLRSGRQKDVPFWRQGAILTFPDSYMLVRMGCAVPADDDCEERAAMTPLQMAVAQKAQDRLMARIEVDDYDLYDAGVILGYKPDATSRSAPDDKYIPGPNWNKYYEMRPPEVADDEDEDE